jgi:hypothetical protein
VRELITQRPKIKEAHALGALLSIDTLWVALCPAECGTSLRAIASRIAHSDAPDSSTKAQHPTLPADSGSRSCAMAFPPSSCPSKLQIDGRFQFFA